MSAIGPGATDSLMDYLPPVGWADVVTKHDLDAAVARLDARMDGLDARIDGLDARIDGLQARIDGLGAGLGAFATKQDLQTHFYVTMTLMVMLLSAFAAFIKFA